MRLQYNLSASDRFSMAELAQMAIEGGCGWINVITSDISDEELRAHLLPDVVELCRESGVILTIDDRIELARELGIHGLRIHATVDTPSPAELRETLGPEAIIGYITADPSTIPAMQAADIDFAATPSRFSNEERKRFIATVKDSEYYLPIVADGEFVPAQAAELFKDGFSAVSVGKIITDADDPVAATEAMNV